MHNTTMYIKTPEGFEVRWDKHGPSAPSYIIMYNVEFLRAEIKYSAQHHAFMLRSRQFIHQQ
jgi:hypothetical protein